MTHFMRWVCENTWSGTCWWNGRGGVDWVYVLNNLLTLVTRTHIHTHSCTTHSPHIHTYTHTHAPHTHHTHTHTHTHARKHACSSSSILMSTLQLRSCGTPSTPFARQWFPPSSPWKRQGRCTSCHPTLSSHASHLYHRPSCLAVIVALFNHSFLE